ncbi:dihydrodipicolinate synthase family protein [Geminicoccaceae bacterium 1502E]|nr:dihydrodipicolinate synthase family protein [Geminicoccaceae bacterium 1502E]
MPLHRAELPAGVARLLREGTVIPAHPLALDEERRLDTVSQRALTRYYVDAGAGGLAVGVHATQFAIREAGLYRPVLELAARTAQEWTGRPLAMVAGLAGPTSQAVGEARTAMDLGYHAGLLSLVALRGADEDALVAHCEAVAAEIPLVGFYLQEAVGGQRLSRGFWRRFAAIDNVVAIKIAPFDRYRTLDVLSGVAEAGAGDRITLYTGNDDHIVLDLLTPFRVPTATGPVEMRIRGGLLGHWSVWTRSAVRLFERLRKAAEAGTVDRELLALDSAVTACNAALFDAANGFRGCIPGCHEVLRRQGLMRTALCLDPGEVMSPGQAEAIERVRRAWPELVDDDFVAENLERWRG